MELFSVACITCRAKLKVTHASAVGQILACPKCGSMVPIDAPPGWKPPVVTGPAPSQPSPPPARKAASATGRAKSPSQSPPPAPLATAPTPDAGAPTDIAHSGSAADSVASAADSGYYTAEPVEPYDDEPLSPPGFPLSAQQQAWRQRIVVVAGLAAGMIVSLGLWWSLPGKKEADKNEAVIPRASADKGTGGVGVTSTPPAPSATTGVQTNTAADLTAAIVASTAGTAPRGTSPNGTVPPIAVASASASLPMPVATAATTSTLPTPLAAAASPSSPTSTAPPIPMLPLASIPPPVAVAAAVDAEAKLAEVVPKFAVDQPLRSAIDTVAALAGVQVNYDWDSPGMRSSLLTERAAVTIDGASLGDILRQLLAPHRLRYTIVDGRVHVGGAAEPDDQPSTVVYAVSDLAPQPAQADELAVLVRGFVAPHTWDTAGGGGTVVVAGTTLSISQTPAVHRQVVVWFDRLRLARGKPAQDPTAVLATRATRARSSLDLPATMNFRPAAPLETVLAHLESACKVTLTVDYPALAVQGIDAGEPIGIAAEKHSLAQVLSAVCDSRGWAWRIVDERAFEITLREALARRPYCEFYDVRPLLTGDTTAAAVEARIRAQLADAGWRDDGGAGRLYFDAPSGRLIVWQHQAAQQRIEKLLTDAVVVSPARATATSAVAPIAAPTGTRLQAAAPAPASTFTPPSP